MSKKTFQHGTPNGYNGHGCTCDLCREAINEYNRQWRKNNPEKAIERDRLRRQANPETVAARARRWQSENPDKMATSRHRRRAQKRGTSTGKIDLSAIPRGVCGICSHPLDHALPHPDPLSPSLDHIVPLSRGGGHVQENIQWSHLRCNSIKGNKLQSEMVLSDRQNT